MSNEIWTSTFEEEESSALSKCFFVLLGMLSVMKTLKNEGYIVIKAFKFTGFEIFRDFWNLMQVYNTLGIYRCKNHWVHTGIIRGKRVSSFGGADHSPCLPTLHIYLLQHYQGKRVNSFGWSRPWPLSPDSPYIPTLVPIVFRMAIASGWNQADKECPGPNNHDY